MDMKNSTLDDIASVVGFTATVRLAAHYGGRDLNVPGEISDKHPIAKLIGISALARLHAEWAGERLAMPTLSVAEIELRNAKILQNLLSGISVQNTAEKNGVTVRRVQQLRRAFEADGILPLVLSVRAEPSDQPTQGDDATGEGAGAEIAENAM